MIRQGYALRFFKMSAEDFVPVTGVVHLHTALGIILECTTVEGIVD
jgi:hypothetical protein